MNRSTNRLLYISKHLLKLPTFKHTFHAMSSQPSITLYTAATPNGTKISIALEELGIPYTAKKVDLSTGVQKEPWFVAINPNGRIPAITDSSFPDGKELHIFESGAILQYLVETYDHDHKISYPKGTREHWEVLQWLFFQNTGIGPMQGQANHFFRFSSEKIAYGINRYITETERLYSVLNAHLASSPSGFIVGDRLTIADISAWGWAHSAPWTGVDFKKFPALQEWVKKVGDRPAVQRGADVPEPSRLKEILNDPKKMEEALQEAQKWIVQK